eukprot:1058764-Prorocentrum_lima.AAC.1
MTSSLVGSEMCIRDRRKEQLLQDFERSLPQLLVCFMPTLPVLCPRHSRAVQVELMCHMMKIMQ